MKKLWKTVAAMAVPMMAISGEALADTSKEGIYQVSEINILPTAMAHGNSVQKMFHTLIETTKKEPGLIEIKVTQQIGQPYNYTVIEQWKDKSSLEASSATASTKEFTQGLQSLLSGPVYQRVFNVFQ